MYPQLLKEYFIADSLYKPWHGLECVWSSPLSNIYIACNEIHIWRVQLDTPFKTIKSFDEIIHDAKRYKPNKFRLVSCRLRYKTSHRSLRNIICLYLHIEPENIQCTFGSFGKPYLSSNINKKQLQFNFSHSGKYALYAITLNRSIGVGLEYIRPALDIEAMVRHFFSYEKNKSFFSILLIGVFIFFISGLLKKPI